MNHGGNSEQSSLGLKDLKISPRYLRFDWKKRTYFREIDTIGQTVLWTPEETKIFLHLMGSRKEVDARGRPLVVEGASRLIQSSTGIEC